MIVANSKNVPDAEVPTNVFAVTDPKWKGRVGIAPTNGSFESFLTAMRVQAGEERTKQFLHDLKANDVKTYNDNALILKAVNDGEIDLGLINHYYWYQLANEIGEDKMVARNHFTLNGDPGALVNVAGVGVLKSADHKDAGRPVRVVPAGQDGPDVLRRQELRVPPVGRACSRCPACPSWPRSRAPTSTCPTCPTSTRRSPCCGRPASSEPDRRSPPAPPARRAAGRPATGAVAGRPAGRAAGRPGRPRPPDRAGRRRRAWWPLAALLPVVYLLVRAGEGGWATVADTLLTERHGPAAGPQPGPGRGGHRCASAVIGVALAWLTVRCDLPGRRAWRVVAALPLAVPSYVGAFAYISVFPGLTGFRGAWLVLTLLSYPLRVPAGGGRPGAHRPLVRGGVPVAGQQRGRAPSGG